MYLTKYFNKYKLPDNQFLIINCLTGALDIVDGETLKQLEKIKKDQKAELSEELFENLKTRGYIFDQAEQEEAQIKQLLHRTKDFASSYEEIRFIICPTYGCNFRCIYCFEGDMPQQKKSVITKKQVDDYFLAVDVLADSMGLENKVLEFFGGEPFMPNTKEIVAYTLKRASEIKCKIDAVTNGYHIDKFIDLFNKYKDMLRTFQVTMDGPAQIHDQRRPLAGGKGTHRQISKGINLLLENGFHVRLRVIIDNQSIEYIEQTAEMIKDNGWSDDENFMAVLAPITDHACTSNMPNFITEDVIAAKVLDIMEKKPELKKIFELYLFRVLGHIISVFDGQAAITLPRFTYCQSNYLLAYCFWPDGFIYPCSEMLGDESLAIGKYSPKFELFEDKLELWRDRNILNIPKCKECSIATFCGGGCAYAAITQKGSHLEPVCNNSKEMLESYISSIKDKLIDQG